MYYSITYFPCNSIFLESYRLLSIFTSRIDLLSKLEIIEINKNNFFLGIRKTKTKPKRIIWMFQKKTRLISSPEYLDLKTISKQTSEIIINIMYTGLFLLCQNTSYIKTPSFQSDVKVISASASGANLDMRQNIAVSFSWCFYSLKHCTSFFHRNMA